MSEDLRRRPLFRYVVTRFDLDNFVGDEAVGYRVHSSPIGSSPLIDRPVHVISAPTLDQARASIPRGCRNLGRGKNDPPDVVEVWV